MRFAYHMYGSGIGELKLEKVDADGKRTQLFYKKGVSENAWREYEVFLPTENYDYEVFQHTI